MKKRSALVERKTKETKIKVSLSLDGRGKSRVKTGIGFLDHMLESLAKHGLFDLEISAAGDLHIDAHHTNEDVGIALGQAFAKALGDKKGIRRFAHAYLPMDETLVRVALDISGRPSFFFDCPLKLNEKKVSYKLEDAEHFLHSFSHNAGINLHVDVLKGKYLHHVIEAVFKGLAKALDGAVQIDPRHDSIPSTKGKL